MHCLRKFDETVGIEEQKSSFLYKTTTSYKKKTHQTLTILAVVPIQSVNKAGNNGANCIGDNGAQKTEQHGAERDKRIHSGVQFAM